MSAASGSFSADAGGLDLDFDDAQLAIADSVANFCRERAPDARVRALRDQGAGYAPELWRELGQLGVLASASALADGGALELVAALEPLGHAAFPGPLVQSLLGAQVLDGRERHAVVEGRSIVAVGEGAHLAWAPVADLFLGVSSQAVHRLTPVGTWSETRSLAGEPWGCGASERGAPLERGAQALVVCDLAIAALLAAGGRRLVEAAAEHARSRRQFGRSIGEFQAVAHPLADALMALDASTLLARRAAAQIDESGFLDDLPPDSSQTGAMASLARRSASRSALRALEAAHQVFGAQGITLEGPAFFVSRWLRGLASLPPQPAWEEPLVGLGGKP